MKITAYRYHWHLVVKIQGAFQESDFTAYERMTAKEIKKLHEEQGLKAFEIEYKGRRKVELYVDVMSQLGTDLMGALDNCKEA